MAVLHHSILNPSLSGSSASFASFSGLKAQRTLSTAAAIPKTKDRTCTKCSAKIRANSQIDHSCSSGSSSVFASVSQTSPAPSAPVLLSASLGAGILGAAAVSFLKGNPPPPLPSPSLPQISFPSSQNGAYIPRVREAAPAALFTMANHFPTAVQEEAFMKAIAAELFDLGFSKDNNIALVNTCRDEVCRPLVNLIDKEFGMSFNTSGLGGLLNCGKTGLKAAMSHSPEFKCDQTGRTKERYIFFAFPHISIGESGEIGSLLRRGRGKPSSACGALIAIRGMIEKGAPIGEDDDDAELVLLRKKVTAQVAKSKNGGNPNLVEVTNAALRAITEDLEHLVSQVVDINTSDYAIITGVQIHSGNQIPGEPFRIERTCDYIAPYTMYAVINGQKRNLVIEQGATMLVRP